MLDHTYCGTPVSQMSDKDLHDCIVDGFKVRNPGELGDPANAEYWIRKRLEVEVVRRHLGLEVR